MLNWSWQGFILIWEKGGLLSHFTQSKIAGSICTSNILLNFYIPHVVLAQSGSSYILNRIHRCIFSEAAEIPQDMEKSTTCQSRMNQIQYSDIHFYCLMATAPDKRNDTVTLETQGERFEPRGHFISRLSLIIRVNVVLNRTVVDSDGCFENLSGSHLQRQIELYHSGY